MGGSDGQGGDAYFKRNSNLLDLKYLKHVYIVIYLSINMKIKYKNEIFHVLKNSEFGIDNFSFVESDRLGYRMTIITFLDKGNKTELHFDIKENSKSFSEFDCSFSTYSPAMKMDGPFPLGEWADINFICEKLKLWMDIEVTTYVEYENQVDLWEAYKRGANLLNVEQPDTNDVTEFTAAERQQIRMSLNDLRLSIPQQFQLAPAQLESVNSRFDYLIEAIERLNKTDWKGILIAQYLSLITTLALNPEQAKNLYDLFIKVLHIIPLLNR